MSIAAIFAKKEMARKKKVKLAQQKLPSSSEGDALLGGAGDDDYKSLEDESQQRIFGQPMDFQLIDEEINLKTVLKLYDNLYWLFTEKGSFPSAEFIKSFHASRFLGKGWNGEGRIPRENILETGCIDWCVGYAFSGANDLLGKIGSSNNNQILVSALLLSVTGAQYINPPNLDNDTFQIIVGALLGVATFIQLFNLVGYIAVANLINEPYTPALSMYARIEADFYMRFLSYTVYVGVGAFVSALIFIAYVGNIIDLYVMIPIVFPLIVFFCFILYTTTHIGFELRKETVYQFYEAFCEPDGRLTQKYLDIAYGDFETQFKVEPSADDKDPSVEDPAADDVADK